MTTASIIPLRDYQHAALDAVSKAEREGVTRQLLVLPTGSGKTIIAAHAVRDIAHPRGWATVMLVHRDELVRQSVEKLAAINPALRVGVVQGERNEAAAPVIVASAQTITRPNRLASLQSAISRPLLLISDEAHHDRAEGRQRAITALGPALLLGFTATPERGDGQGLGDVYQDIVYQMGMLDLMGRGKLARLVGIRVGTDVSLDGVRTTAGEFNESDLAAAVDSPARNALVVRAWQTYAADRRRTVVFCVTVEHAENVCAAFRAAGVDADTVFGHTPEEQRRDVLRRFHEGRLPVLVNVMVLTEGYDEPGIDCILMARPTKGRGLYVQCVGRGARPAEDKPNCLVLDVVDVSRRHKLVGIASLADGDPDAPAEPDLGVPFDILEAVSGRRQARMARLARRTEAVNLFSASPWLWRTAAGLHMAPAGRGAWLVLREEPGGYVPVFLERHAGERPSWQPLFDRPLALDMAMGVAETAADRIVPPGELQLSQKAAPWRQKAEPPTMAQRDFANRLGVVVGPDETKASLSLRLDDATFLNAWRRAQP